MKAFVGISFYLLLVVVFLSCQKTIKKANHNQFSTPLLQTDSTIVSNLINQSITFFEKNIITATAYDDYLKQAEEIAIKNNFNEQLSQIYNVVGVRHRNRSEYNKALIYHDKAVKIARDIENKSLMAKYINTLAVVYRRIDENKHALDLHMEAMKIAENIRDTFQTSVAINGIGNIYINLKRYHSAIEYFKKSLAIAQNRNNILGLAINNNNIGETLLKMNLVDSALVYFTKSLNYNTQINSTVGKAINHNSFAYAYNMKKQYNLAIQHLEKALIFNKQSRDRINISVSYSTLGETYYLKKDYPNAINNLNTGLKIAEDIGSKYQIEACSRLLSKIYESLSNNKKALLHLKIAEAYKDSIINEENLRHSTTLETMRKFEQTQNQLTALNNKTELQKKLILQQKKTITGTIILAIVLIIAAVLVYRQIKLRSKYNNILMQQRLLRTQMNPHFIFNALSAIQVYILENDMEKSSLFLSDFASLMRQVLRSSQYEYMPLSEEKKMLDYYLELQRLRFVHPFSYKITIAEDIDADNILLPPMITQPFVENAIEHGIKGLGTNGRIEVRFFIMDSNLAIEIEDNGIGWKASQKTPPIGKKHESMAIKITNERLDVIRRVTHKKAYFKIIDIQENTPNQSGVLVQFELPILSRDQKTKLNKKVKPF